MGRLWGQSQDQPGQHSETPSLLKIQKVGRSWGQEIETNYLGCWGTRIIWTWEAEVAVSQDQATALQPGQQSETVSKKTKQSLMYSYIPACMKCMYSLTYNIHSVNTGNHELWNMYSWLYEYMYSVNTYIHDVWKHVLMNVWIDVLENVWIHVPECIKICNVPGAMAYASNSSTLGGQGGWIMRSVVQDQLGQHSETPSLLKIQKVAGHGGMLL